MKDVLCVGELLIDFISVNKDVSLADSEGFGKNPGGAPANVAAGVARLGLSSGFIGKVGDDPFGYYLRQVLDDENVDTSHMAFDPLCRTTLSFVALRPDGARDCMFFRNPGADMTLAPEDIDADYVRDFRILHFGSVSLGCEPCKSAVLKAVECARANRQIISYDPNLRLSLWDSEERAIDEINAAFPLADIVKISEEEAGFITGLNAAEDVADYILSKGAKLVVVTLGADGCYYSNGRHRGRLGGYPVEVVETTGAGDAFVAALLSGMVKRIGRPDIFDIDNEMLECLRGANAAGALATTKMGAIPSLPDSGQLSEFQRNHAS